MTRNEMLICYPGYAAKERMLELKAWYRQALDRAIKILEDAMRRPGRELSTRPGLTPGLCDGENADG